MSKHDHSFDRLLLLMICIIIICFIYTIYNTIETNKLLHELNKIK